MKRVRGADAVPGSQFGRPQVVIGFEWNQAELFERSKVVVVESEIPAAQRTNQALEHHERADRNQRVRKILEPTACLVSSLPEILYGINRDT